jgi:microcystin-dependent protein
MTQPYVGEIRMFGGNFAPYGWAFCDGSLISIADNSVLFTLIGTTYGGDGTSTFGLPNLLSRMPIHAGLGSTQTSYVLGQVGGLEEVTLKTNQIPSHTHTLTASGNNASANVPTSNLLATTASGNPYTAAAAGIAMNAASVAQVGSSMPHDNMMPFLCVSFIISLFGIYPPQS